jgi:hypothetical protein
MISLLCTKIFHVFLKKISFSSEKRYSVTALSDEIIFRLDFAFSLRDREDWKVWNSANDRMRTEKFVLSYTFYVMQYSTDKNLIYALYESHKHLIQIKLKCL